MPELGLYGSVRGAVSNHRPYRDHRVRGLVSASLVTIDVRLS